MRPQQLWLRKAFFQIHLWAGILLALYVIAIGISGSILVFQEELSPRPHISVPQLDLRHCTPQQIEQNIALANRTYPGLETYLVDCPDEANPLFALTLRKPGSESTKHPPNPLTVYIHPLTGAIVGQADLDASWLHWVEDFHIYLLSGRTGEMWNGIGAAVLLLLALTGIVLWWPGINRWRRALLLDLRRGWKRINWDLHSVIGAWTILFTLIWATTGIYFAWPKLATSAINHISPIVTASYPAQQLASLSTSVKPNGATFQLSDVLHQAQQISPDAAFEGCFFGSGPHAMFTVYMAHRRIGDFTNTDFIYFDQASGQHLYTWRRGQNITLGDWLLWIAVPLHFGTSWGLAFKTLWALVGLALPLLAITGLLMYWNRYLRKWRRST